MRAKNAKELPAEPTEDVLVSLRTAATITGHDRDYIRKRLRETDTGPTWRGRNRVWSLREIWLAVGPPSHAAAAGNPDDLKPTDRAAWYQGENSRLAVERRAAGLIPAAEFAVVRVRVASLMNRMIDTALAGMPDCGCTPQMVETARRYMAPARKTLEEFAHG